MLTAETLIGILLCIAAFSLVSRRIEQFIITLPIVFTAIGLALGELGAELVPMEAETEIIHTIAEVTLILILFSDASRVSFKRLRGDLAIPARMLMIGMPLTILFGTLVALSVSPGEPWPLALLVAAILTPTDAALGQTVVTSPSVPQRIRQSINVESGLNDGLALPIVIIAAVMASEAAGVEAEGVPENIALFALAQVTLGPLAGAAVGFISARLLDRAIAARYATLVFQGIYFLSVAFLSYFVAEWIGGNGFIAAFIAGLTFGNTLKMSNDFIGEFMESEGQILTMLTFIIFGAVLAPAGLEHLSWLTLMLAVLFLTVIRMLPIYLSLTGLGLTSYEKLFLGWFGPRGLASILFALLVLERFPVPGSEELVACVVLTVLISIVAHGVTAAPMSARFTRSGGGR